MVCTCQTVSTDTDVQRVPMSVQRACSKAHQTAATLPARGRSTALRRPRRRKSWKATGTAWNPTEEIPNCAPALLQAQTATAHRAQPMHFAVDPSDPYCLAAGFRSQGLGLRVRVLVFVGLQVVQ